MTTSSTSNKHISSLLILVVCLTWIVSAQDTISSCANCLYGSQYCDPANLCLYGCNPGWVGSKCSSRCRLTGCTECALGVNGIEECTRCPAGSGMYGPLCNLRCSPNCNGGQHQDVCDHYGNCLYGCKKPYIGLSCKEQDCPYLNCERCALNSANNLYCSVCHEGYFWSHESENCIKCSQHCLDPEHGCDVISGNCRSGLCEPGWFGGPCDNHCYINSCSSCDIKNDNIYCILCQSGMYPSSDKKTCVSCAGKNCNGPCDRGNGLCPAGCIEGWFGIGRLCDKKCSVPDCDKCTVNFNNNIVCKECKDGFYMEYQKCTPCPEHCKQDGGEICDAFTGVCSSGCSYGYYGNKCSDSCSNNCNNSCDSNGYCDSCVENWFGNRCDRTCPVHCVDCVTKYVNGTCELCEAGWYGPTCDDRCSLNCQKDSYSGYIYCDKLTGHCGKGCSVGYYGDKCDRMCNLHCDGNNCHRINGSCTIGCDLNWYGEFCVNPCPNNCNRDRSYLRWCDADKGNCLHGCKPGFTGSHCTEECQANCKGAACTQDSGECLDGCKVGYSGKTCDNICKPNCPNDCSPNCRNDYCDPTTKSCLTGCVTGWFGTNCREICSETCKGRVCKQLTGECVGDCLNGFYGLECEFYCNKQCLDRSCNRAGNCIKGCAMNSDGLGFHGDQCEKLCSTDCKNGTCVQGTGVCHGCGTGRHGDQCDQDCLPGTYGEHCMSECGHCKDYSPCYILDGRCPSGCETGWTGPRCMQALQTSGSGAGNNETLQIAVGCTVAVIFCCLALIGVVCWFKHKKAPKKKVEEPTVVYKDTQVHIETLQYPGPSTLGPSTLVTDSARSSTSVQSYTPLILGDGGGGAQIKLGELIIKGEYCDIHHGGVVRQGQKEDACLKLVTLKDLSDEKTFLSRLLQEAEMLSLCGPHSNITRLITTYQNTDVYCVALDNSIQTGLLPYLLGLQTGDKELDPVYNYKILQFCIDASQTVCHLNKLKVIHRALQAGHMYLSDTLVAKLGDFYWAECGMGVATEENEPIRPQLPEEYYPWLPPESLMRKEFVQQSEIWCLGMLLWEIFTLGRTPYPSLTPGAHTEAVMEGIRPSKPDLAHFTLYRLMKSCWRYDCDDRPTPDQVLQQLIDIQGRYTDVEKIVVQV